MSLLRKILWFVLGGFAFVLGVIAMFLAAFYVPSGWGVAVIGVAAIALSFFYRDSYEKVEKFIKTSKPLYYFVSGVGVAFVLVILAFVSAMVWGIYSTN